MIVLVGESASGKSTVERELCNLYDYKHIISYTTRPLRKDEKQDVNYHFISEDKFLELKNKDFFAEYTKYRDWYYGTAKEDCSVDKIIVANPHGLRQLRKIFQTDVKAFYLKVSERERLIRIIKRGDDIFECFRRIFSDQGVFQNIEEDCDHVIYCDGLTPKEIAERIYKEVTNNEKINFGM